MNRDEIENLFNDSYERVIGGALGGGLSKDFFREFYDRFIAASPEVRKAFEHTDMERQYLMLKQSFVYLLNYYATSNVNDFLHEAAMRHSKRDLDIRPELYDLWLDCLIETLRAHDPRCTSAVEEAWRAVLQPGIEYMIANYAADG